jgi:hypothetical protein
MPTFSVSVSQADYNRIMAAYQARAAGKPAQPGPPPTVTQATVEADLLTYLNSVVAQKYGQDKAAEAGQGYVPVAPGPP